MNSEIRQCKNCEKNFTIEGDDFGLYEKLSVPPPTWCPFCRFIRKMTFVNERSLYKRNCGNCGAFIISAYNQNAPFPVWCIKCYLSDSWDSRNYGVEYNFTKTFFEQFQELKNNVPHRALDKNEKNGEGTEYVNFCYSSKNVYLSFNITGSENIKYCKYVFKRNKNCMDSLIFIENDRGYELVQAVGNYNSSFLIESNQCIDSHFLYDCSNCVSCCLSSNIRNKSYVFNNIQLTKDEYTKAVNELELHTYNGQSQTRNTFEKLVKKAIHKYAHIKNSVNATGDFIENSKNTNNCYGVVNSENLKNTFFSMNIAKDSQDLIFTGRLEECYEVAYGGRGMSHVAFSFSCGSGSSNIMYCDNCKNCSDCFGCIAMEKKQYCILNKQYSKEEYFELVEKIKVHMNDVPYKDNVGRMHAFGEYFPSELSPFAYNETVAFEENPLSKDEIISSGYRWKDPEPKPYVPTMQADVLSDSIHDVNDTICNEIIACKNQGKVETQCTSAFRILPDELSFYKQMNLPLPRYCPNCRYYNRLIWKNPFHFYKRQCMCGTANAPENTVNHDHTGQCLNEFETMYAPDRPETIYCKKCYQQEVY